MARLRHALATHPDARRFIVHGDQHPSFDELVSASDGFPISVVGLPVGDTCKEVIDGVVRQTVPRERLVDLRGPWVFSREGLEETLGRAAEGEPDAGDLVSLSRAVRLPVRVLAGPWSHGWTRR